MLTTMPPHACVLALLRMMPAQNAVTLRKATKKLRLALKGIADITYANAPLPYQPVGEARDATLRAFGTVYAARWCSRVLLLGVYQRLAELGVCCNCFHAPVAYTCVL